MQKIIDITAILCGFGGALVAIAGSVQLLEIFASAGLCLAILGSVQNFVSFIRVQSDLFWAGYINIEEEN